MKPFSTARLQKDRQGLLKIKSRIRVILLFCVRLAGVDLLLTRGKLVDLYFRDKRSGYFLYGHIPVYFKVTRLPDVF